MRQRSFSFKKLIKYLAIAFVVLVCFWLIYIFAVLKPSNDRNWEFGTEALPTIDIQGDLVSIGGVRDFHFKPKEISSIKYINRTVDIKKIERVWFLVEPFSKFQGIAHTYFVFDIKGEEPVAVSVEARREKGEKFDALTGLFNQYELIYIWGSESDETIRRVIFEENKLYMYPLVISSLGSKALFLQLAERTRDLQTKPRFYNTLLSNCTNELAKSANRVKPGAIPLNIALFLPGYSAEELYKLGYIPHKFAVEQLQQKYFISDFVRDNYEQADFSKRLRTYLDLIQ